MAENNTGQHPTLFASLITRLEQLGRARDGMIVGLAVVYILGFVSWAVYSLRTNIGFIRIFDAQYLIGGILPSLLISIVYLGWRWSPKSPRMRAAYLSFCLIPYIVAAILISPSQEGEWTWLAFNFDRWRRELDNLRHLGFSTALLLYVTMLPLLGAMMMYTREGIEYAIAKLLDEISGLIRITGWVSVALIGLTSLLTAFAAIWIYIFVLYPGLPQALGGPAPRCASIALDPNKLPQALLRKFGLSTDELKTGTVLLTDAHVLYNDDKIIIFKPSNAGNDLTSVEVRKELVDSIAWCKD